MISGKRKTARFFRDRVMTRRLRLVVASLAMSFFAFVPVIDALCALEELPASASAATAVLSTGEHSPADDACCAAISAEIVQSNSLLFQDDRAVFQPVSVAFSDALALDLRAHRALDAEPVATPPPPEPVSRRFPRLLI